MTRSLAAQTVAIAYPYPHEVSARFHHSLMRLLTFDASPSGHQRVMRGDLISNSSGANVTNARNEIVQQFLADSEKPDWLLWIDTDMVFDGQGGRAGFDLVERLVKSAHPEKRPIVGALCFSWQNGAFAAPTTYMLREDGKIGRLFNYPKNQLVEVDATGAGCLLVHRSVFETIAARGKGPKAYPWFQESALGHELEFQSSEDITFCIRARACGFPIYVDTSIVVGHEKPIVIDERVFDAQQRAAMLEPSEVPTFVVVATAGDRPHLLDPLCSVLEGESHVMVFAGVEPLHVKWNAGLVEAEKSAREAGFDAWNVAVLNDDLHVEPGFLTRLARGLRSHDDYWVSYPNYHGWDVPDGQVVATVSDGRGPSMSGWAFMLRGETGLRFDERFAWWYGDTDLQMQVQAAGKKVVAVGGCYARHLHPMESSKRPELLAMARSDEARYAEKWGVDPSSLWLARHPEFGVVS